jgi:acyl carrier protein
MNKSIIEPQVRAFIVDAFLFGQQDALGNGDSFLENGTLDSTGVLQLIAYLEETFSFTVKDDEVTPDNLDSVIKIATYVESKLAARAPDVSHHSIHDGERSKS